MPFSSRKSGSSILQESIFRKEALKKVKAAFGNISQFNQIVNHVRNIRQPTEEVIDVINAHLKRFGYEEYIGNQIMMERLEAILGGEMRPESVDIDFMQHEYLDRILVDHGITKDYESYPKSHFVWDPAHDITRTVLGVNEVYHPDAIQAGESFWLDD